MSKPFLKQRTNGCDTLIPFLFEKFFASAMCIRQIYECNQLHRYIVCVVVVIVCKKTTTLGKRHTDRADMQFKDVFFVAQCQHHLNYIDIPCPELSCFTMTVFQNFRIECMVYTVYVSKQRRLIDHIIILV